MDEKLVMVASGPASHFVPDPAQLQESESAAEMLADIRRFAGNSVTMDDVHVFGTRIANTRTISFYGEFTPESLDELASLVPGAPVMFAHDWAHQVPIGKFFSAKREYVDNPEYPRRANYWLTALGYVPKDAEGDAIMRRIALKVYDETSATWSFVGVDCSVCGQDMRECGHWPGAVYEEGGIARFMMSGMTGFWEGSFVFRGAADGTHSFPVSAMASAGEHATAVQKLDDWSKIKVLPATLGLGGCGCDKPALAMLGAALDMQRRQPAADQNVRTSVQSVLLPKGRFETAARAAAWCRRHSFRADKIDTPETGDYFRARQFDPGRCQDGSERTITLEKGVSKPIKAVICRKKEQAGAVEPAATLGAALDRVE